MNLELITVCVLLATSSALCAAMFIAWAYLGRHPYALMWAIAGGCITLQWVIVIVGHFAFPNAMLPSIISGTLVVIGSSLIAIACRHRAGLKPRIGGFVAINLIALAALTYVVVILQDAAWRAFVTNFACSALFMVTVAAILSRGRKSQMIEFAMGGVTLLFAIFELAVAVKALLIGAHDIAPAAVAYRNVLGVGLPTSYVALGIGAVMLLVADLAGKLEALNTRDWQTGAMNRRGLDQAGVSAMANARRRRLPLAAAVIELRGFEPVASRLGRLSSERLLTQVADQLNAMIREEDVFARLDGVRFCLLLSDTRLYQANEVIALAKAQIAQIDHGVPGVPPLLAVAGVAQLKPRDFAFSSLLKRAEAEVETGGPAGGTRPHLLSRPAA